MKTISHNTINIFIFLINCVDLVYKYWVLYSDCKSAKGIYLLKSIFAIFLP